MMIEPPGDVGVCGVFKIDNSVDIAIEQMNLQIAGRPDAQGPYMRIRHWNSTRLFRKRVIKAAEAAPSKQ